MWAKMLAGGILVSMITANSPALPQQAPHTFDEAIIAEAQTFPLWEGGAPGALGNSEADQPTLTYYPPVHPNGSAVVVIPGGGYQMVAVNHEGRQIANWFNAAGIAAFVLKYRLGPRYHHPIEIGDAHRAIRIVRSKAAQFGVKPDRIGVIGFSAGGHLAATTATHFDAGNASASDPIERAGCRPDFAILGYAVISFTAPYTHQGSRHNLLGDNPDPALVKSLSAEFQVTPQTPPTFLLSGGKDDAVPPENSVAFYLALRNAGVPAELHIFEKAPHGFGLATGDPTLSVWPTLLANWLRGEGMLPK